MGKTSTVDLYHRQQIINSIMKTFKATNKVSAQLKQRIQSVLDTHGKYKNAYFWSSAGNASQRRRNEEKFAESNPDFNIETKNGLVEVSFSYSESCKNIYYSLDIRLDGEKKDIRLLKKIAGIK